MSWKEIDEKLIRRGELLLDVDFLENYQQEVEVMNGGRRAVPSGWPAAISSRRPVAFS